MTTLDLPKEQLASDDAEELVREYKKNGSIELRNQLVMHYSYIIKWIVSKMSSTYYKYGSSEEMLHQGVIAMIDSLHRFDPDKGVKFSTFAYIKVRGSIIDYVRKQDRLPRRVRQTNIRLNSIEEELTSKLGRIPTRMEMAEAAGMTLKEYDQCVLEISGDNISSYEALMESPSHMHPSTLYKNEFDPEENIDKQELREALAQAIDCLNEQERTVLSLYYYENLKMKEIGQVMGVTEQRIGQINQNLIKKLRKFMTPYI